MAEEVPEPSLADRLLGAPGWIFHVACGLGALSMLWAASSPTGLELARDPFAWLGLACALIWAVRLCVSASRRAATMAFLLVPVLGGILGGAYYVEIPQESRWLQAQGGFETALRALPTAKAWDQAVADETVPPRIGSYWVSGVSRDSAGAAQFHLGNAPAGLASARGASFTYLVDGPTEQVREANPGSTFEHLHGNWYVVRPAG
ncbi:MAG TPA: hypothetical protein VMZ00_07660 [Sporichthya sp.]|nr:hypothetical protein [Sporichthya sp.]